MKREYDFRGGKRGAIEPIPPGKKRITIRLDSEIIEWFRRKVEKKGGGNYQSMINSALKEHIDNKRETFEAIIRRVIKEEIKKSIFNKSTILNRAIYENAGTDIRSFKKDQVK